MSGLLGDNRPPGPAPPQDESNPCGEIAGEDPSAQVSAPHGKMHTVMEEDEDDIRMDDEKKQRDADDLSRGEPDAGQKDDSGEELLRLQHECTRKNKDEVQKLQDIHGDVHADMSHPSDLSSVSPEGSLDISDLNAAPEPKHEDEVQRPASAEIREFLQKTQLQASRVTPEEALRENIRSTDKKIEAVQAQSASLQKGQSQQLQSLRLKRQASQAELSELLLRRASERVQESMHTFHDHVLERPSQWAGIQDIPDKMAAALKEYPPYKLSMHELMSHETHDAHTRSLWKSLIRKLQSRAEDMIDELHYHVVQQDEALDIEMIRMQAHIRQLQQFTEEGEKRPSTSERKQAARVASKLKEDMQHLSEVVTSASRVIGWLEFDHDDHKGRLEYVGQLLRGDGDDEDVEDGLGVMVWRDGCSYAGEFRNGSLDGFGHETYGDGATYKGQFVRDQRHGLGVFVSGPSGQRYSGGWKEGERHGLALQSMETQGHAAYELVSFHHGKLERRVVDDSKKQALSLQMSEMMNDAMEMASLARQLAPDIQNRTAEFHDQESIRKSIEESFSAVLLGPQQAEASAGPEDPEAHTRTRPVKPHDSLDTWLVDINLPQALASPIKKVGYQTPDQLLPLLLNTEAYDSFTEAINLKARHARLLWKALEDLDVILTPRSIGGQGPAAAEYEEDEEKMKQFRHLFQRCCDKTDEQGQPRMSMMGLHKAFVAMHVPHELSQLEQIMSRIDINSDGHIDLREFTVAVSEMEKMRWNAAQETARRQALKAEQERAEEERKHKAEMLAARRAEEREKLQAEQRARDEAERQRVEAELAAKSEFERREAEQKRAEEEERRIIAAAADEERKRLAEKERLRREAMEEEERRRIEAQEKADLEEKKRLWAEEMFRRTIAAGRLQYALRGSLARNTMVATFRAMIKAAGKLQAAWKSHSSQAHWHSLLCQSTVLQSTVRRAVPSKSLTLALAWSEVEPASDEVIKMHNRINGASVTWEQFLNPRLNVPNQQVRCVPRDVPGLLWAIDYERSLVSRAELEIATIAAASNVMFRLYVRRKAKAIRSRLSEKKKMMLEAERERQRLMDERQAREVKRMQVWLAAEREMVKKQKETAERQQKARDAAIKAASQEAAAKVAAINAQECARLRQKIERQKQKVQDRISDARRRGEGRIAEAQISVSARIRMEDRLQHTPLKQRMTWIVERTWGKWGEVQAGLRHVVPWDANTALAPTGTISRPARLEPLPEVQLHASSLSPSPAATLETVGASQAEAQAQVRLRMHKESRRLEPIRTGLWQKTGLRVKTPELQAGAISISEWEDAHPHAAVRPRTSVRRLMLIQAEIRLRHIRRMEARANRKHMIRIQAMAGVKRAQDDQHELTAATDERKHYCMYLQEWEQKMEEISQLENQAEAQKFALGGLSVHHGLPQGSSWLNVPNRVAARLAITPGMRPGSSRRPPSLSVSVLAKRARFNWSSQSRDAG